ncbi:MAG: 30S ribosomal protein S7 [candidate division WOR-3 bacterium]
MPRGKYHIRRPALRPDPKYNNIILEKFINHVMRRGKKSIARKIVYSALELAEKQTKKQPMQLFAQALKNASPSLEVKTRRIGGANYQVPTQVRNERKKFLAMKWILEGARQRKGKSMIEKLAAEIIDAAQNQGNAIKRKEMMHRQAEANKAFAYLAW